MEISVLLLWLIVVAMLTVLLLKGLFSSDASTSCLTWVVALFTAAIGCVSAAFYGLGKLVGWW